MEKIPPPTNPTIQPSITLLHVTHITAKSEFHTAKLFILIESVQILILLIEDVMILKKINRKGL